MIIKYLKLVNYRRFPLRDLELFEYEFIKKLLLILGPNGSGKSSLLSELTPLPSTKDNFFKGGYKEIHIEKDNNQYYLISDFTDSPKYSFLFNNEELNKSNNITIQKELVFQHFKITPEIHDILIGHQTFSSMSMIHRKKLFNNITHLNIDSILSNYENLKEQLKTQELLLKTQHNLHQSEVSKLIDKDKLESLKINEQLIKDNMDVLIEIRENLVKHKEDTDLEPIFTNFKLISNRLKLFYDKYYTFLTSYPINDYYNLFTKYTTKINNINFMLQSQYTNLEKYQSDIKAIEIRKENNITELNSRLKTLTDTKNNIISNLNIFKDTIINTNDLSKSKTNLINSELYKVEMALSSLLYEIPINSFTNPDSDIPTNKYTKSKYEDLLNIKNNLLKELDLILLNESNVNKEIKHIEEYHSEQHTKCPKCNYSWKPNYNEQLLKSLKDKLTIINESKVIQQNKIEEINKQIEDIVSYFSLYKQYTNVKISTYDNLKPLWELIDNNGYIFNDPPKILSLLKLANLDINSISDIENINEQIVNVSSNINIINSTNTIDFEELYFSISEINFDIDYLLKEKSDIEVYLNNLEISKKVNITFSKLIDEFNLNKNLLFTTNLSLAIKNIVNEIDQELSMLKISMIEIKTQISNYDNLSYIIDKYSKDIEETKDNIVVLNSILIELSPKNGLIAKTISNYLNSIIKYINSVISSIWEYKMVIKVIDIENDNLDYKFKVEVEDKNITPDISKASSGMKEIIDLSFRLVIYKLLNLENYPLYLDELAARLDDAHSLKMLELVHRLVNDDKYSQIFLITHKERYGNLRDMETLILG